MLYSLLNIYLYINIQGVTVSRMFYRYAPPSPEIVFVFFSHALKLLQPTIAGNTVEIALYLW